ncbi:MAG TPA: sigma-70 family RNA polymerase sigma factor [Candidatus Blautia faecavium]|uniref:Sigma-70 family RNA polymerase sigma factor n=1 Tax=Candidatus Blautia faecavium TaxID=2838487 RepID=A0A9D2LVM0_9FIRM|nr:sigma-70 family RNA polymerase sigma factor [Candidatus Blautia faecavium]
MRSPEEIDRAMKLYADTVRRVCMIYLKNYADTEDIFQTVFLKYLQNTQVFENPEHEKAWFIRVSINACKDLKKNFFRSRTVSLDTLVSQPAVQSSDTNEVLEAVLSLPQKYRNVIYLHYYEGYTAPQISRLLGKKVNTIYTLLTRARLLLKEKLGGEDYE